LLVSASTDALGDGGDHIEQESCIRASELDLDRLQQRIDHLDEDLLCRSLAHLSQHLLHLGFTGLSCSHPVRCHSLHLRTSSVIGHRHRVGSAGQFGRCE
jgi:hypothetical protein